MPAVGVFTLNPALDHTIHLGRLVPGEVHRATSSTLHPGGKGVNVATLLADAGVEVCSMGLLGDGNASRFEAHFRERGIGDKMLRIPGETRTGIKLLEDTPPRTTDVNLPGIPYDNALTATLCAQVEDAAGRCAWMLFCGSLPPGAPEDLYARLIGATRMGGAARVRTALDTSGAPLAAARDAAPHCIKPNLDEFRAWAGERLETVEAVEAAAGVWFASGTGTILLSLGAAGAAFLQPGRRVYARGLRVPVVGTVGAGDALLAGWVSGELAGEGFEGCARRAVAYAACAVQRVEAGLPEREVVEAHVREVELHDDARWLAEILATGHASG